MYANIEQQETLPKNRLPRSSMCQQQQKQQQKQQNKYSIVL